MQTDASTTGLGAVLLKQDSHVIAYTSRTKFKQQYSVIQREYLIAVYAMKQFRHYLLGKHLQFTDYSPLQWLFNQKMEGLLCCRNLTYPLEGLIEWQC